MPEHAVSPATLTAAWPPTPIAVCPATQVAARARAMAAAAADRVLAAPLVGPPPADQAAPGAAVPLDGYRCRRRYCLGTFRGRREHVGQARAFLAAFLGGWARADDAVLLIGELGANAVVHTGSGQPGGLFTVRAVLAGPRLRAEVEDQGSSWDGRLEDAECPHGLFLLRQLSTRCGTRRGRDGWATWFVLDSRTTV
jgi:serine/threonine-protein kinase RsbW